MVGPALIAVAALFPVVLFLPLLSTKVPFVAYRDIELMRIAFELFAIDKFLFFVVVVLGMALPACKMLFAVVAWYVLPISVVRECSFVMWLLAKFAMLDILLLAVFIVAFKGIGIGFVQIRFGFYVYATIVLGSLVLAVIFERLASKLISQEGI